MTQSSPSGWQARLPRTLAFLAGLSVVILSLYTTFHSYQEIAALYDPAQAGNDPVSAWDRRIRKILPDLPAEGTIGYMADWNIPDAKYSFGDQYGEWILTRYALAPHFVKRSGEYDFIVGNFSEPKSEEWFQQTFGVSILKDYDGGLYLLKGPAR